MKHVPSSPRRDGWRPTGISIGLRGGNVGPLKIVWKWRPDRAKNGRS